MAAQVSMTGAVDMNGEGELDLENEPPLLEELGINLDDVVARTKVLNWIPKW